LGFDDLAAVKSEQKTYNHSTTKRQEGCYQKTVEIIVIGGLSAFLNVRSQVRVYVPASLRGVRGIKEVISVSEPAEIHENVFSTGELDGIEQSMAVKTDKGIVLIVGCSHPRMAHILKAASQFGNIVAIVGGMHGFSEFELFKDLELICPAHCTAYKAQIKSRYPDKCVGAGAGKVIEI